MLNAWNDWLESSVCFMMMPAEFFILQRKAVEQCDICFLICSLLTEQIGGLYDAGHGKDGQGDHWDEADGHCQKCGLWPRISSIIFRTYFCLLWPSSSIFPIFLWLSRYCLFVLCVFFFPGIAPNFHITKLMTLSLYFENKETKRERKSNVCTIEIS